MDKIKKIIALGCSYTYGHGLDDCFDPDDITRPGSAPSKYAWPNVLARNLGVSNVINLSQPGSSMKYALHTLAHNKNLADKSTLVVCMPPEPHRSFRMGHNDDDHLLNSAPSGSITNLEHKAWLRSLDEKDAMATSILHCELLREYCNSLTGRSPIIVLTSYNDTTIEKKKMPTHIQKSLYAHKHFQESINLSLRDSLNITRYPTAKDGKHPGLFWHKNVGVFLAKKIKDKCLL